MGSAGVAAATRGKGAFTLAPIVGPEMVRGKPQRAAGGGSGAGGTMERSEGGVGVMAQFATLRGRPRHPENARSQPARMTRTIRAVRSMPTPGNILRISTSQMRACVLI